MTNATIVEWLASRWWARTDNGTVVAVSPYSFVQSYGVPLGVGVRVWLSAERIKRDWLRV